MSSVQSLYFPVPSSLKLLGFEDVNLRKKNRILKKKFTLYFHVTRKEITEYFVWNISLNTNALVLLSR